MLTLGDSIGTRDGQLPEHARIVERRSTGNLIATSRTRYAHRTTGLASVNGGQVPSASFRRESIEHRPQEVH